MFLGICDISGEVDGSINWSVNEHAKDHEESYTKDEVTREVVYEHVISHADLVLGAQVVEDCDNWYEVVHTDGHVGEHCPGLRAIEPSESLCLASKSWHQDHRDANQIEWEGERSIESSHHSSGSGRGACHEWCLPKDASENTEDTNHVDEVSWCLVVSKHFNQSAGEGVFESADMSSFLSESDIHKTHANTQEEGAQVEKWVHEHLRKEFFAVVVLVVGGNGGPIVG